jgi:hypothetical protein
MSVASQSVIGQNLDAQSVHGQDFLEEQLPKIFGVKQVHTIHTFTHIHTIHTIHTLV